MDGQVDFPAMRALDIAASTVLSSSDKCYSKTLLSLELSVAPYCSGRECEEEPARDFVPPAVCSIARRAPEYEQPELVAYLDDSPI